MEFYTLYVFGDKTREACYEKHKDMDFLIYKNIVAISKKAKLSSGFITRFHCVLFSISK